MSQAGSATNSGEEREPLDVVPVGWEISRWPRTALAGRLERLPQVVGAGHAAVKDQQGAVVGPDFDAGGVAAVAERRRPR